MSALAEIKEAILSLSLEDKARFVGWMEEHRDTLMALSEAPQSELWPDDPISEIHEIRRQIAAEAGYDPYEMGRRLRELEKQMPERMFKTRRVLVPVTPTQSDWGGGEPPAK